MLPPWTLCQPLLWAEWSSTHQLFHEFVEGLLCLIKFEPAESRIAKVDLQNVLNVFHLYNVDVETLHVARFQSSSISRFLAPIFDMNYWIHYSPIRLMVLRLMGLAKTWTIHFDAPEELLMLSVRLYVTIVETANTDEWKRNHSIIPQDSHPARC